MKHECDSKSIEQIDEALSKWSQGDIRCDTNIEFVHLADLSRPHSSAYLSISKSQITTHEGSESLGVELVSEKEIEGFVGKFILTFAQTELDSEDMTFG